MNKLITTDTGGFPYVLDDIRWEQDAYRGSFEALAKMIRESGTSDSILWGCEVTDNTTTFDVAAGAVIIDGEIHQVAAVTGLTKAASQTLYIAASTASYDAAGLKTFQDAATHNTYNIRKATASIGIVPGGQISLSTTGAAAIPLKRDYMAHNFMGLGTKIALGSAALDDTGSYYATNSIIAATAPVYFWKRGRMVELYGGFAQTGPTSVTTRYRVGSLPTGYRPVSNVMINGYASNNANEEFCIFEIESGGDIYVRGDLHNTIYATGVTFSATVGIIINGSFAI